MAISPAGPGGAMVVLALLVMLHTTFVAAQQPGDPAQPNARLWLASAGPVPELIVPSGLQEWQRQRAQIRQQLWRLLGTLPPRSAAGPVRTLDRQERDGLVVERIQFDNGAGATVPGYVVSPIGGTGRKPAILWCHWHGGQYDNGKEEIFRSEHTPEVPAVALARRGYVVLAIDAYCFGERNGQGPGGPAEKGGAGEMTASKFQLWMGRSLWGMIVRDDLIALDYLASRPDVDSDRIGVTGISMGATRSWWLMALDERFRAGVAVACMTRYQDLILAEGLKYHGIYYFVPGLLNHFDTEAVVSLAAPRPLLVLTGDKDAGSPVSGVRVIEGKVSAVYRLHGSANAFESRIYENTGHEYTRDMWARMLEWMDRHLQSRSP